MEVIFNADDFGRSSDINRAVLQAHREGVLTSASLMVTGDAVDEAVALARVTPSLAVGLHLALSDGRPASSPDELPHLLCSRDRFPTNPARVWIRYTSCAAARAEMVRELGAQFERFIATGLPLDHVNSHQHIHMQPAVFHALLPLARQYGARGMRLPRDDFGLAIHYDRRGALIKAVWAAVFGVLCRRYARALGVATPRARQPAAAHGLAVTDRVYGLMQSGRMEEAYVLQVLARAPGVSSAQNVTPNGPASRLPRRRAASEESLHSATQDSSLSWRRCEAFGTEPLRRTPKVVELYFHPTLASQAEPLGPNRGDLATLLSPAVRQAIEAYGWTLARYATLAEER
jgi:hopanoid biosynthesis associated protein HpnK